MEARTAFRGSGISIRMSAVVVAVVLAFALGGVGGYLVKAASPHVVPVATKPVAGQPAAPSYGSAWNYSSRRSGTQSIEGPAPAGALINPLFRVPTAGRNGPES